MQLSANSPILIKFGEHNLSSSPLKRIGIMFATWARVNHGTGRIIFSNGQNNFYSTDFDISEIEDNKYTYFNAGENPIDSAEIRSIDGGGVSIWQVKYDTGDISSCLTFEFINGAKKFTPGCPTP